LALFLNENRSLFGKMHETAFNCFKRYYNTLAKQEKTESNKSGKKDGTAPYVDKFSIGQVVAERLRFGLPAAEDLKGYSEGSTCRIQFL
jgi:hypothetical protein